jgi:glycosyltransferase involved in cell wall biosynthesis
MKILHATGDWKWTGPAEPMLNAVVGLRARGHTVDLACPASPPGYSGALAERCRERDVQPELLFERRRGYRPLRDRMEIRRLRDKIRDERYDLVHVHHTRDHLLVWRAIRALDTSLVVSWHGGAPLPRASWHRIRLGPRMAPGLVVLSERVAESARRLGAVGGRVAVIPGAVDTERFRPLARSDPLRCEFGLAPTHRVLGVVARLQPHRRFDLLLDALALAHRAAPGLRLLVVGRGTRARQVLEGPVRDLGLEEAVVRAGYRRDDYREVLALVDALVFLVPGSDGSCRAVLEAMAMEIPTIATRRGILPDTVTDGETGRLVDESPEALAEALLDVWQNPEAWALRGKAARRRVLARHTTGAQADRLERFYREVIGES